MLKLSISEPNIIRSGSDGYRFFYDAVVMKRQNTVTLKGHNFRLTITPDKAIEVTSTGLPASTPPKTFNTFHDTAGKQEHLTPGKFAQLLE
jgi:hypothetical protein